MKLTRRSSLSLMLAGAVAPALRAQTESRPINITTGPLLQSPTDTSMAVTWITDREATGVVEYGVEGGPLTTVFNSTDGLINANERLHQVVLRDLKPGTQYRYRVVSRDIVKFEPYKVTYGETATSEFKTFRTLDATKRSMSFIVLNDLHDIPESIPLLVKLVGAKPYDLAIFNGDIISYVEDEATITKMMDSAVQTFASEIPMVWVRGNHETRGKYARQFKSYMASPNGRYYYSFDHGPVHFTVLDSGEDKIDEYPAYAGLVDFFRYRREQGEWLKQEVQSAAFKRAKYRVVISHMPFAQKPGQRQTREVPDPFLGMDDAFKHFGATLNAAGVDIMFSAHMHRAAIVNPEEGWHNYPIVRGGGPKDAGRAAIRVDVDDKTLTATVVMADGSTFGVCKVDAKR